MARRKPRDARFLGLWTAGWLAVFLVAGLLWVGDVSRQWPVLQEMDSEGDYPEVVWGYADTIAAGELPGSGKDGEGVPDSAMAQVTEGLGC